MFSEFSSGQGWYRFSNVFKVFAQKNVAYFEAVAEKCCGKTQDIYSVEMYVNQEICK